MSTVTKLPFFTLMLLITLGTVNAIFFTPSMPEIASFFNISTALTQSTITWYLAGYALGQLIYSPFANRYGRKPALFIGLCLGLIATLICITSAQTGSFTQFLLGRFLLALGAGSGFKMAFTLVHDVYDAHEGHKMTSYLICAFAIIPGVVLSLAGYLTQHYGWLSCQWFGLVYICITAALVALLPETKLQKDLNALKLKVLLSHYGKEISRGNLWQAGFMMGLVTAITYSFSAAGPFVGMQLLGLNATQYGVLCLLPQGGMLIGALLAAFLVKKHLYHYNLPTGISISILFALLMCFGLKFNISPVMMLFMNAGLIYLGASLIFTAGPTIAFKGAHDSSYTSGLLNFINLTFSTFLISGFSLLPLHLLTLPLALLIFALIAGLIFLVARRG